MQIGHIIRKYRKEKQDNVFVEEMRKNLLECFADQETFGFLKNEKRYLEIIQRRDY